MAEDARIVAVLVPNPALSSILSMVLASTPSLRVEPFESRAALTAHMRQAPVDLVVCDFEDADGIARDLRSDAAPHGRGVEIIALSSTVDSDSRRRAAEAGIDEVIVKPMSPRYLLERVQARLRQRRR
jgi:two-component system phosphate regulon response regulator PhoB